MGLPSPHPPTLRCCGRRLPRSDFGGKTEQENCPRLGHRLIDRRWGQGGSRHIPRLLDKSLYCLFDKLNFGELALASFQTELKSMAGFWAPVVSGVLCGQLKLGSGPTPLESPCTLQLGPVPPPTSLPGSHCEPAHGLPGPKALLTVAWLLSWIPSTPARAKVPPASPGFPGDKGRSFPMMGLVTQTAAFLVAQRTAFARYTHLRVVV